MSQTAQQLESSGLEVVEARSAFGSRERRSHSTKDSLGAMNRIAKAFGASPEQVLQELVNAAVELCGADSAGVSVERDNATDEQFYHWIATAGQYSGFTDAILPRYPSACGVCLERGKAQRFTVGQPFFDILGVSAPLVTDGILLPWNTDKTRGTIFVMSHSPEPVFDEDDVDTMELLCNFAEMAVRQLEVHKAEIEVERKQAVAELSHALAHQLNNPLQGLTNILYLAAQDKLTTAARDNAEGAQFELDRITSLVREVLTTPKA